MNMLSPSLEVQIFFNEEDIELLKKIDYIVQIVRHMHSLTHSLTTTPDIRSCQTF